MPRNIVIVSEAADAKGGASLAAIASGLALADAGFSVHFFAATGPFNPPRPVPTNFRVHTMADGLNLIEAPRLQRITQSLWNGKAADAFAQFVSGLSPEETVVHVHSFQVQLTSSVVRKAVEMDFPIVYTAHDYGIACPYSGFYNYNTGAPCGKHALSLGCATTLCNDSKSIAGKLWHLGKGNLQRGKGRVPAAFDHLIFVSEFSRRILRKYLHPQQPTSIVLNPIDLPHEGPRPLASNAPFLFVGRLTHEKGGLTFAQATAKMNAPAVLVGAGPEEESIRGANPNIQMRGWLHPREVREEMRQARALVFPSRWYEGEPLTVQEAQSVGLPVVVSDACAARERVVEGETGYIFRSGDADDLAAKLALLDDSTATRLGVETHRRFWSYPPSVQRHVNGVLDVYNEVWRARGWGRFS